MTSVICNMIAMYVNLKINHYYCAIKYDCLPQVFIVSYYSIL